MSHKKQHIIPRCYLKSWCDPSAPQNYEPYVWIFSKDGTSVQRKAPVNIFYENDYYTVARPSGERSLVLEHGLSELEGKFTEIRCKKLKHRKSLTGTEKFELSSFVAAMHCRTKPFLEHQKRQWQHLKSKMDKFREHFESATPEQKRILSTLPHAPGDQEDIMTAEELEYISENTIEVALPSHIQAEAPEYFKMDHVILETNESPGFITSDRPCVWFDPKAVTRPPLMQTAGLAYPTIEVTLPISPQQLLLINHAGLTGYIPVPKRLVDEMNRRTRFYCQNNFIVSKNFKEDFWFDKGEEPADSWRKTYGARSNSE